MFLQGMPLLEGSNVQLRRHGDVFQRLPGGYYVAKGRSDDTMNLGGIKVILLPKIPPINYGMQLVIDQDTSL